MKSNRHSDPAPPPLQRAPTSTPTTATVPIASLAPIAPPPRLEPTLPDGLRLGSFEIKGVISQSRAAIVYRAVDHSLNIPAAIKEFMPAGVARRGRGEMVEPIEPWHEDTVDLGRRAFLAESRALARCDDPALLRVTQLWEINGTAYRVMPLYSGKRLADLRRHMKAPIDEYALRALLGRLLDALEAFHASAGVHGNVNPANILMPSLDRPVLLGTGRTGMLLATELGEAGRSDFEAAFAAPEQHEANATVGVSADLFGLAQTLRYCITGGPPIGHESVRAAIHRALGSGAASYSDALLDALTSATAVAPAERPQSLDEFRQRLRRLETQGAAATADVPAAPPATSAEPVSAVVTSFVKPAPPAEAERAPDTGPVAPGGRGGPGVPMPPTAPATLAAATATAAPSPTVAVPPATDLDAPENPDDAIDETIDVSSVLGDLMQGPAEPPRSRPGALAAERAEEPPAKAAEPRVEPTLNFGPQSPGLRISELPDRVPRAPAQKPPRETAAGGAAAGLAGASEASPDAPFVFHAYGFDAADPARAKAAGVPARPKRSLWQVLRLGVFAVGLAAVTTVTILAVTGVWDPRGPELKLPPPHSPEATSPATGTAASPPPQAATERPPPSTTLPAATPPPTAAAPATPSPVPQTPEVGAVAAPPVAEAPASAAASAPATSAAAAPPPAAPRADAKSASRESTASGTKRRGSAAASGETAQTIPREASPREACAGRTQFALFRCMQTQCGRSRWYSHPDCARLRKEEGAG